ncbi:sulfate transporter, putative [Pediculus humanus corporis]|uniref:Sulfate transporter, putative n=1 Tax=Pediculus humanus subsp. corporis TaxID=121224 RepID=E0VH84_PEDHC|nr:sulfate transporter, putative [Pediculus humanus corporis]EEB12740.1 sulfate transporter, putative [Pediculus humanus corporis]
MAENEIETAGFLEKDGRGTGRIVRRDSVNKQYGRQPSSHCSRVVKIIKNKISSDLLAGLTVGLTAIPQGIAYAVVAGLEPQYGLYSGFMGCFVYFFLGSVKDVTIGPTAIMALMSQKSVEEYNSDFAVLLCFLTGCVTMLFGILQLGFLVNFISVPVTVGFTTAAAITIASSQIKGLLGIKGKSNEFLESWISVFEHIKETRYQDLLLGLVTIFLLVLLKIANEKISKKYKNQSSLSNNDKAIKETFRIVGLGRNAIVVVLGTLTAFIFEQYNMCPFTLTGEVAGGLPPFKPPPFSTNVINKNNETEYMPFEKMVANMGTGIISVPVISVLETIAIAKAFAKGKTLDATQEMMALGACNIAGSFVRSMPTAGSFTRTAVNNASNVKTPLGGIFTGLIVLLALSLTATFKYIPKSTLAGLILTAMFYMMETHEIKLIWKTKKTDIIPLVVTIFGCLFLGLDLGIIVGIFVNILFVLYNAVRPKITKEEIMISDQEVLVVRPEQALYYPGAEYVRELIMKSSKTQTKNLIVLDGTFYTKQYKYINWFPLLHVGMWDIGLFDTLD